MLEALRTARAAIDALLADKALCDRVSGVPALLADRFKAGGKVLICGNGGSACDAMHFAEELTARFSKERAALPALACTDPGHLTCAANDFGWERVFSRWVEALGRKEDVLIVLSTSGSSPNIVRTLEAGRALGLTSVALLAKGGGACRGKSDIELVFPGDTSDRIQELHMIVLHSWVEAVETILYPATR